MATKKRNAHEKQATEPVPEAELERIVSLEEAAAILGVSKTTLYRWLDEGRLKGMKAGRQWRFYERDVKAVLADATEAVDATQSLRELFSRLKEKAEPKEVAAFEKAAVPGTVRTPEEWADQLVRLAMLIAMNRKVSDILFQPMKGRLCLRFKHVTAWWVLLEAPAATAAVQAIVSTVKRMTGMNAAQRQGTQDGRGTATLEGREIDIRANTFPQVFGEGICMRILDTDVLIPPLEKIGLQPSDLDSLQGILRGSEGLVVVGGPTGSGKTTLLYSMLLELNAAERNVMTIEDPVEMTFPGISQAQVHEASGYTFTAALQGIFRHAPDVILCGEVRDRDTLEILLKASLTGNLCLTTLHVPDTVRALTRMKDIGAENFLVADALRMIIAMRLVRSLCPHCRRRHTPDPAVFTRLGIPEEGGFFAGKGCAACHGTGFARARPIFEVLTVNELVRERIRNGATETEFRRMADVSGTRTLAGEGLRMAREGITTLEEVARVLK